MVVDVPAEGPVDPLVATPRRGVGEEHAVAVAQEALVTALEQVQERDRAVGSDDLGRSWVSPKFPSITGGWLGPRPRVNRFAPTAGTVSACDASAVGCRGSEAIWRHSGCRVIHLLHRANSRRENGR